MYGTSEEGQDRIRKLNPDKYHCPFLEMAADACESLPDGIERMIPDSKTGEPCPMNPYFKYREHLSDLAAHDDLQREVDDLCFLRDIHRLPALDKMTPREYALLKAIRAFETDQKAKARKEADEESRRTRMAADIRNPRRR